ncbi:MAG: ABC transporter permease subunit [Leptotrichiaceae bacterium]|nr:ABC transporter permease subunit [Leptotrichiaceae bacterium]
MMDIELLTAIKDTFVMVFIPVLCAVFLGIPLGAAVFLTNKGSVKENMYINIPCNAYINIVRSFPFLIFVVVLIPFTRLVFGTAFGLLPASFPICFVGVALYARFVEQSFYDVDSGIIDAALSMKATLFQTVWHFLLVEARSSLVLGLTSSIISFISYSTVMGVVGGGGIGDYAMRYGYNEYNYALVYKVVAIMIFIVFSIQISGNGIAKKLDKRRRTN